MNKVQAEIKDILEDYFYNKTKDFLFNDYEEEERKADVNDIGASCIEDVLQSIKWYTNELDDYLDNYELHRMEDLKEYEYKIKHRQY